MAPALHSFWFLDKVEPHSSRLLVDDQANPPDFTFHSCALLLIANKHFVAFVLSFQVNCNSAIAARYDFLQSIPFTKAPHHTHTNRITLLFVFCYYFYSIYCSVLVIGLFLEQIEFSVIEFSLV